MPEGNLDTHLDTQAGTTGDAAPAVGESEHDKAMLQRADDGLNLDSNNNNNNQGGDLLAGKYKDEAALNKGVTELLKMQYPEMSVADIYKGLETGKLVPSSTASANDQAGDKDMGGEPKPGDEGDVGKDASESELAPLDPVTLTTERDANDGQLTPETRERLIKEYNIPEATLDTYLAGLTALETQFVDQVYDLAGGEEKYQNLLGWMNDNVPEAELDAFNGQLATQDVDKVKMAVNGMNARYQAVVGNNPNLLRPIGSDLSTGTNGAYASKAQWLSDVAKPEYKTDPAFRERVMQRVAISPGI